NGNDVWMTQHRGSACFSPETRQRGVVFYKLAREDLHRYVVANVYATRAINDAHAAFAQLRDELILTVDLVSDEWIGIDELNRGEGADEVVFVIRMCAGSGQC